MDRWVTLIGILFLCISVPASAYDSGDSGNQTALNLTALNLTTNEVIGDEGTVNTSTLGIGDDWGEWYSSIQSSGSGMPLNTLDLSGLGLEKIGSSEISGLIAVLVAFILSLFGITMN